MHRILLLAVISGLAMSLHAQQPTQKHFDGQTWWNHVKVLADDNMEGRETGSAGLRKAEAYIVEQLTKAGLEAAGTQGFYQPVEIIERRIDERSSSALSSVAVRPTAPPRRGRLLQPPSDLATREVTAPLIFVGYGLQVPERKLDELAGLDLHGKIVVYLAGSPVDIPTALAAHYQSMPERWKALRAAGAIGTISIPNPASMDIPWSRMSLNRAHPSMELAAPEFRRPPGSRWPSPSILRGPEALRRLRHTSRHRSLGKDRKPLPHFALAASLKARASVKRRKIESANLVARLPGTDPALKNEHVVLSAHVDHLGIGEAINGDRIYNGAMDNGSGSALLLDMAANLAKSAEKPRRSILFVFVTGEEKGLLGSKYFATHPTVAPQSMVADINVDMFLPIVPVRILKVQGLAESDLGDRAAAIAQALGVKAIADPEPLRNGFIRSDQYSFIRRGIPALKLDIGFELGTPEQKIFKDWLTAHYHAPSDDLNQPVDLGAAALYEEIMRQLLLAVADADARPAWKPDSFFRRFAAGAR